MDLTPVESARKVAIWKLNPFSTLSMSMKESAACIDSEYAEVKKIEAGLTQNNRADL